MRLGNQKRISAEMLGVGKSKVWFDTEHMTEIKEAITKGDVRTLIRKRIIQNGWKRNRYFGGRSNWKKNAGCGIGRSLL